MHIYAGSCSNTDLPTGTSPGPPLNMPPPQLHILKRGPAVFFIKLSGDVETNPDPKTHRSVKGLVLNARSLTSSVKMDNTT